MTILPVTRMPIAVLKLMVGLGLLLLLWAAGGQARADIDQPLAWVMKGENSTVFLLGSIHMLPQPAEPMPERVRDLYEQADTLTLELDLTALDPLAFHVLVAEYGQADDGRQLPDYMDEQIWEQVSLLASKADVNLHMLEDLKPWLAALTVTQVRLLQLGYSPASGLDMWLTTRAMEDGKPVRGLESAEDQLRAFDGLSSEEQTALLLESLGDAATLDKEMRRIVAAWQRGDRKVLEDELLGSMRSSPGLYSTIVVDRNRSWLGQIQELLDQPGTHLVIVGTLHLLGEDSVIRMLRVRGLSVEPL